MKKKRWQYKKKRKIFITNYSEIKKLNRIKNGLKEGKIVFRKDRMGNWH